VSKRKEDIIIKSICSKDNFGEERQGLSSVSMSMREYVCRYAGDEKQSNGYIKMHCA
jgi:hypothetical protein